MKSRNTVSKLGKSMTKNSFDKITATNYEEMMGEILTKETGEPSEKRMSAYQQWLDKENTSTTVALTKTKSDNNKISS